jgi:hypothetical protein
MTMYTLCILQVKNAAVTRDIFKGAAIHISLPPGPALESLQLLVRGAGAAVTPVYTGAEKYVVCDPGDETKVRDLRDLLKHCHKKEK